MEDKKNITVLSLFDGIGCCRVALERAGIKIRKFYASEIDKYAIQTAQKNYPDTIQLGDINNWKEWNIDWSKIDLVTAGSPCQGFSNSGKGLNFDDPRSALFFVFVDILNYIKNLNQNVKFLLENVKMKKEWAEIISNCLNVKGVEINSSLVSAQNRKRIYWTDIKNFFQIPDKNIFVKDILLSNEAINKNNIRFKYCNEKNMHHIMRPYGSKAQIITSETLKTPTLIAAMGMGGGNGIYLAEKIHSAENAFNIKNGVIFVGDKLYPTQLQDGFWRFRKLHPIECERLQTLPDNYTNNLSTSQRYKSLGNGWTVDIIAHILKFI